MAVIKGILGKKIGMTQIFRDGEAIPVTVITAGPCYVLEIKRQEEHGYNALKIGYEEMKPNARKATKPVLGQFRKVNIKPLRYVKEIRIDDPSVLDKYQVGQELKVNIFKVGEYVDVTGKSKGKGFQGGVKRWGWHIGPKSHGSMSHRQIGSVGASSDPSRVFKGHHMPGHMGNERVTVQNLEVIDIDVDKNLILVKGAVPGARDTLLLIRSAKKKEAELIIEEPKGEGETEQEELKNEGEGS